jgi:CspA family cold shock protein
VTRPDTASSGVVAAFDDDIGIGTVHGDDGNDYRFHCVELADGTRTIAVGTHVEFRVLPKLGVYEAGSLAAP